MHVDRDGIDKMGRDMWWVYSKGWTQFPYVGLTQICEVARGRFVYPFVSGDITTMKSGTIENVLAVTTTATATRSYFDSAGFVRNNLAADTVRQTFEGGRQQLVVEGTNVNRVVAPRDLTNAAWVTTGATVAKDQIGADGNANAGNRITATAANATVLQTISDATSRTRTFEAIVRRSAGTGVVKMTLDGGATSQDITASLAAGFKRIPIPTQTLANPSVGFILATSGDAIVVDFCSTDDTVFATSPVPAASTRNPENVSFKENAALQSAAGTLAIKASNAKSPTGSFMSGDSGRMFGRNANANQAVIGLASGATVSVPAGSGSLTGDFGMAITYDATDVRACLNGGTVVSDAGPVAAHTGGMKIGMTGTNATSQIGGFIDALYAGPTKIPDAQLQALAVAHLAA